MYEREMTMKKRLSDVVGFENCVDYIIYNDGRIYSERSKKFLKPLKDTKGYCYLDIRNKGAIYKCPKIHRLVMMCFYLGNEEKEHINHKDGDKNNNHIDNLEYVTNKENRKHAIKNKLKDEYDYGISQHDLDGNLLKTFQTGREALLYMGRNPNNGGNIGRCIRGSRETAYGYIWRKYESSTTISKESTPQANGGGKGEHLTEMKI